jgi:hypothetical protein
MNTAGRSATFCITSLLVIACKDKGDPAPPAASVAAAAAPAAKPGAITKADFSKPTGRCEVKGTNHCTDLYGDDRAAHELCDRYSGTFVMGKACEITDKTLGSCSLGEDVLSDGTASPWKRVVWTDDSVDDFGREANLKGAKEICDTEKPDLFKLMGHDWKDGPAAAPNAKAAPKH